MKGGSISVMYEFQKRYGLALANDILDIQIGLIQLDSKKEKDLLSMTFTCNHCRQSPCECETGLPDYKQEFMVTGMSIPDHIQTMEDLSKWYLGQSPATHLHTTYAFPDGYALEDLTSGIK